MYSSEPLIFSGETGILKALVVLLVTFGFPATETAGCSEQEKLTGEITMAPGTSRQLRSDLHIGGRLCRG